MCHTGAMSPPALVRIVAVLTLVACGGKDVEPAPVYPPDQPGPHQVGVIEDELQSSSGIPLPVQIWYPTGATDGPSATPTMPRSVRAPGS